MVCPSCSALNPDGLKFCGHCGRGLSPADDSQTVLLDGSAAAAPARAPLPQVAAGLITPPPEGPPSATWGPAAPGTALPSALAPGSSFGSRYRIECLLGEGGMGAVYKAYDTELDRTVALKLVRPEFANSKQTMQRFKQELLLASKISHKNVLRIHDLGDSGGIKFISMAYVEGTDLAGLMERQGILPLDRALKFTRQLCEGLEAAHREGVVHRDLKPQNILIDAADNLYISDFGLAKSLESEITAMTRTGQILGTPRYMSPEQVEATEIDSRSDLYSLGLILYEMVTGELPFRGDSAIQLMYQRVTERSKDPRSVCPDLPEYVARIILKCLEKDPAKRYQSAREILRDLDSQQAPVVSSPVGAQTISIVIPKPKASWLFTGAAALAVIAGLLFALPVTRNWLLHRPSASASIAKPKHYLAVLPLNTMGDDSLRYLANGISDTLSAKLAALNEVYIASPAIVTAAAGRPDLQKDPGKLAAAMGVKLLVRGTVQKSGDTISISISLDDVSGTVPSFRREFPGDRRDLLTLESNIFNELVKALAISRSNEERTRTTRRPTEDVDAYDLYLQGRDLLRGKHDVENIQHALDLFTNAAKRDATFDLAYAGMADASMMMWDQTKNPEWTQKALNAAQQARGLNDDRPESHLALGMVYTLTGKTQEAIAELKRALRLEPNSDDALRRLGKAYEAAGMKTEAIDAYNRAIQINPLLWRNSFDLASAYVKLGANDKAVPLFLTAEHLQPDNPSILANLGVAYYNLGKWNECIPVFQKAIDIQPKPLYYSNLGVAYFFSGKYREAAEIFAKAAGLSPNDPRIRVNLADAYRWSGEAAKAGPAYDDAISVAFKSLDVNSKDTVALGIVAVSYAKKGNDQEASKFIRSARQLKPDDEDLIYKEATIHALAGRTQQALASLGGALRHGHSVEEAKSDPELKALRERPEFQTLLKGLASNQAK